MSGGAWRWLWARWPWWLIPLLVTLLLGLLLRGQGPVSGGDAGAAQGAPVDIPLHYDLPAGSQ